MKKRDASQKDTEINCLKINTCFTDGETKTAITWPTCKIVLRKGNIKLD